MTRVSTSEYRTGQIPPGIERYSPSLINLIEVSLSVFQSLSLFRPVLLPMQLLVVILLYLN